MRIIPSKIKIRQKHFRFFVLVTLSLICIISSIAISRLLNNNTTDTNLGLQFVTQNRSGFNLLQSNHTTPGPNALPWKPEKQPTPITNATPATTSSSSFSFIGTNGLSPSGQAMPDGNPPGWQEIFADDFNTDAPVGSFPGKVYGRKFTVYPDGTKDTAGQSGAPSRYYPSKVVSVSNGLLNLYLHTENGTPMAAAILPILPGNHLYGKYTIRFRSDALPGFKTAWLLWPDSENWPHDGEMDFPEAPLDGTIGAFMHHQDGTSGSDQDEYNSTATYTSWHTASIEWSPSAVNFILDGQSIGTSTNQIPSTPMHWVIQTESCLPTCPAASTAGNLQIDWVVAYAPA
jgi:hypothetical protein